MPDDPRGVHIYSLCVHHTYSVNSISSSELTVAVAPDSALAGVKRILNGTALRGALTPSLAFGPDFVKEVFSEGDEWKVVVHEFTHTRL
jgi:short subunit dehydrogenase-like uncharacterized protein